MSGSHVKRKVENNGSENKAKLKAAQNPSAVLIDGSDLVLGRAASKIAKLLLNDKVMVYLVNAEKMFITGNKKDIVEKWRVRRSLKNKANPEHSPHYPRVPHLLVKRVIRGMLPWKKSTGKAAYKRLRVFTGMPKDLEQIGSNTSDTSADGNNTLKRVEIKEAVKKNTYGMYVIDLCSNLGYKE